MDIDLQAPLRLKIYTAARCRDCQMAKKVLDQAGVDYEQIDIDSDPGAADLVVAINGGYRTVPTIIFPDGRVLVEPRRGELLSAISQSVQHQIEGCD